jgi:two-component system chemotaxis sensor kinase CheA
MHLPYLNLRKEFDIKMPYPARLEVIVLEYDDKKIGLIVDQVQNEYQVVLRPLGKFLKDSEMLLGAAIIGEGNIALVLDTDRIIKRVISENTAKTNLDAR